MSVDFALPDLGEGLTESEIVAWRVAVGDEVTLNQIIADVETAKAVVELPSPYTGRVVRLYAEPGVIVGVGDPIVAFDIEGSTPAGPVSMPDAAESGPDAAPEANLVGYGAAPESARPQRRARRVESAHAEVLVPEPVAATPASRPLSTPPVRKLAHDLGVDLGAITGSGEHGVITRADVEAAVGASASGRKTSTPTGTASADGGDRVTRRPIHGVRKHTAAAMVRSAFTAPHVTEFLTVDVTATMELIARLKADRALAEHRIGILAVTAKALCIALKRNPSLNSSWDEDAGEIAEFHYVNLGIAAATPRGLIVPNIADADGMTLVGLADALRELTDVARAGTTPPARLAGGTITITNIGVFGIDAGTPILNPGEAAILAMGAVRREPREHDGGIAVREVMTLSLSFDHRLVDGEQGSRFLADIGAILRDPARVLAMV